MRSRWALLVLGMLFSLAGWTLAGDEPMEAPKEAPKDFTEFSRLLHKIVVAKVPKEVEDSSGWGGTIPIPGKLRLPGLRVRVKVGDHDELPHGLWRKFRVWLDDPAQNIAVQVRDFKKTEANTFRLTLDSQAAFHGEVELMHWQKGLPLIRLTSQADATLGMNLDCDVAVSFKPKVFPPELLIEPKIVGCKLILQDFTLRRVGKVLEGDKAKEVGNDLKDYFQKALTFIEPEVKTRVNDAIAQGIREGQGTISASTLLRLMTPGK
jgi:hypothetical protein